MSRPMAKTLDEMVRETLGSQVIEIVLLRAENAALQARVAELTTKPETSDQAPDGGT